MTMAVLLIFTVFVVILLINVFFGYWRSNTRRLSLQWVLAIHIPVPLAIGLRLAFLGWNWYQLPLFIGAFAIGQYSGGRVRGLLAKKSVPLSSFLIADISKLVATWRKKND